MNGELGCGIEIATAGRTDLGNLFGLSGILGYKSLPHTPFLAFLATGTKVEVRIVESAKAAAELPEATPLMVQWRGQWESDFFRLTAGDVRRALASRKAIAS